MIKSPGMGLWLQLLDDQNVRREAYVESPPPPYGLKTSDLKAIELFEAMEPIVWVAVNAVDPDKNLSRNDLTRMIREGEISEKLMSGVCVIDDAVLKENLPGDLYKAISLYRTEHLQSE